MKIKCKEVCLKGLGIVLVACLFTGCGTSESEKQPIPIEQAIVDLVITEDYVSKSLEEGKSMQTLREEAFQYAQQEDKAKESYQFFKQIVEQEPENPWGYIQMANEYRKVGNIGKALEYVEQGKQYIESQKKKDEKETEPAIKMHNAKMLADAYYFAGVTYWNAIRYEGEGYRMKALEMLDEGMKVEGMDEQDRANYIHANRSYVDRLCAAHKELEYRCIDATKELMQVDFKNGPNYFYRLAYLYAAAGEFELVDQCLSYIEMNEKDSHYFYFQYYIYKGEDDKVEEYMKVIEKAKGYGDIYRYHLAKATYANLVGDTEGVKKYVELICDEDPTRITFPLITTLIEESGVTIDPKYREALEEEKRQNYSISLE